MYTITDGRNTPPVPLPPPPVLTVGETVVVVGVLVGAKSAVTESLPVVGSENDDEVPAAVHADASGPVQIHPVNVYPVAGVSETVTGTS